MPRSHPSLFGFGDFKLPNWRRSAKREEEADADAPTPAKPVEAEKKEGGSLFEEVVEEAEVAEKKSKKKTWTEVRVVWRAEGCPRFHIPAPFRRREPH